MQPSELEQLVKQQSSHLERLLFLIEQEKSLLIARDADKLLSLASDKSTVLEQVKALDSQLSTVDDKSVFHQQPLSSLIDTAKAQMAECQLKNQENSGSYEFCKASNNS